MSDELTRLAAEINDHFGAADVAGDEHRIAAGQKLNAAQALVVGRQNSRSGAALWREWLKANVRRSERDCRKVMALARAPDPTAALRQERGKARDGMRRKRRSNVRPAASTSVSPMCDEERVRYAVEQARALRETLTAIANPNKRARATELVDTVLDDVWEDIARRNRNGEIKRRAA
jgi:hypothetical protein